MAPQAPARRALGALAAVLSLLALGAAPAVAEVRSGSLSDPAGDSTTAAHDITRVSGSYDDATGAIAVTVTLGAAPSGTAAVVAIVGTPSTSGCTGPLVGMGASTDPADATALTVLGDDNSQRPATRTISGSDLVVAATDAVYAGRSYACVTVTIKEGTTVVDSLDTALLLTAPAPPVTTPTTTSTTPTATTPTTTAPTATKAPLTRAQKLARALKACRKKRGAARTRCIAKARAKYAPPLTRAQKLSRALKACRTRTGGARTRCIAAARRRYGPATTTPSNPKAPLAGRLFYYPGTDISFVCGGTCWEGYAFVDDRWAYRGIREDDGFFPKCTARTAQGDAGEGCVPYTYDPKARKGTVDGRAFTVGPTGTTVKVEGKLTYSEGATFPPGSKTAFSLKGISVFGSPFVAQTVTTRWLEAGTDGRFVVSSLTLGSFGGPGALIESHYSGAPPDSRGRYEFLPGGILRRTYDDGSVTTTNVFVLDDKTSTAATEGLFIGGIMYFVPSP